MKTTVILITAAFILPTLASPADYNLGELAQAGKLNVFNRAFDQSKAGSPEVVYLNAAANDGLAWISGVEFSAGTIELEIKGKNAPGQSFVGIAFHGRDNTTFDAVYLRPFNFQASEAARRNHAIQYVSLPAHDWRNLRSDHPGKYESAITPIPAPDNWVRLKLVIAGRSVSAFVNGAAEPALSVELLNDRLTGTVGLWVGNGSDGWFRNLNVTRGRSHKVSTPGLQP